MFNSDFYPTPDVLIKELLAMSWTGVDVRFKDIDRFTIKGRVLEPSAGKGNIVDYIRKKSPSIKVDAIESDSELSNFLMGAGHTVVWSDFLTFETFREYDAIVMNPPFSADDKHLRHAIQLASKQITKDCSIYAIINAETLKNPYSTSRKDLVRLLDIFDAKIKYVSGAFSDAERKTGVEVALVYLSVRRDDASEDLYKRTVNVVAGAGLADEESLTTALSTVVDHQELRERVNDITRLIYEYEQAVKLTRDAYESDKRKSDFLAYISNVNGGKLTTPYEQPAKNYEDDIQRLRAAYWGLILRTDEFMRKLTKEARDKLSRQLDAATDLEINATNVYMLLQAVLANSSDMLISSVVSMFEKITSYSKRDYTSNIHYYNGWRTNDAHKIGKKIVYPFFTQFGAWEMGEKEKAFSGVTWSVKEFIFDLLKAFEPFRDVSYDFERAGVGEYENDILRFKLFGKGTVHVWFKDADTLSKINYVAGRKFNWIPTEDELREDPKAREYVSKEFGDIATDVSRLLGGK